MENQVKNDFIDRFTDNSIGMLFIKERYKLDDVALQLFNRIKNKKFKLVYVTASLPSKVIQEKIESIKLDDYFIIDSVSSSISSDLSPTEKSIFLKSPADLTEIGISLEGILRKYQNTLFIVIDSLTSLLIYNSENEILRFVHFTSSLAREKKSKLVFIVLENNGVSKGFLDKIRSFIDEEAFIE